MEMIHCPGCAADLDDGRAACPVCGAAHAVPRARRPLRNPFKLIALCAVYALAFWSGAMCAVETAFGADGLTEGSGSLLLASIGLSIALTVRGKLPGTAQPGQY